MKKNKNVETIVIDWNKFRDKSFNYPKEHEVIVKKFIKQANDHFKKDGWDLDFNFIKDEILTEVMGYSIETAMINEVFKKKDRQIIWKEGRMLIHKTTGKKKK